MKTSQMAIHGKVVNERWCIYKLEYDTEKKEKHEEDLNELIWNDLQDIFVAKERKEKYL